MTAAEAERSVADQLVAARAAGRSLSGYPGAAPASMAEAYRIQELAMSRWPDVLVGWKIGFIPPERRTSEPADRLVGPIWRRQLRTVDGFGPVADVGVFRSGFAAVEAELVVRLSDDLPDHDGDHWTADGVAELDQQLMVGIEVASSPIPDINSLGPTVIAADFGNNNGLVLGPAVPQSAESPVRLRCFVGGQLLGEGSADNLPGGLHHGLATALNVLAGRGQPVRAGMLFATGAITGIHPIGAGQHCRVELPGGPGVELRTSNAESLVRR